MGFEKLRVYQAAVDLDAEIRTLIPLLQRGFASDVDQLKRSVGSILFNIAEASASETPGKKRKSLDIARGEAEEVRAVLRRLVAWKAVEESTTRRAAQLTIVVGKMLTVWISGTRVQR